MTLDEVMKELAAKGSESTKKTFLRHGASEPLFGVKIGDMKPIQKRIKGDQQLALDLYATGNGDAMYLAGLVADGSKMTKAQLNRWAKAATWHMISSCTVAWVAAEHADGFAIAQGWTDSAREHIAVAGWSTLAALLATTADTELPIKDVASLLSRVIKEIHAAPNRVRYAMNQYVICCGTYVAPLAEKAIKAAQRIGLITVDMGDTACQVPDAASYIIKSRRGAPVAPKRKTTRC